jgi:heat shock protein 4
VGEYLIKDVPSATESGAVPTVRVFTEHDKDGIFRIKKVEYMKEVKKEEPKEGETAEKKEGEEEIADKKGDKKTYVAVSLPFVETNTGSLTPEQMVAFQAKEGKMAAQDRELVEKDAKKNELETYVYDMRDKLSDKFKPYATSSDSDALNAMLDQVESWLYSDEGYEGTLVSFQGKLDSCKKLGDPITLRYDEAQERPIAVSEFNNAIENGKRFLNKQGIDEAFFHLTDDDWAKLRDTNKEYKTWMAEEVYKQGSKALTDPPAFTADSVRRKLANYNQICNPIMNKPKPKEVPKATETKKEEVRFI